VVKTRSTDLLAEIEAGALDSGSDLPDLLRKCVSLGGATGSARLREWASLELKGYGPTDELPPYRLTSSLLYLDGSTMTAQIRGQQVPLTMIPEVARQSIQGDIHLPQPISELVALVDSARRNGEDAIRLAPPLVQELLALMNHQLAKADGPTHIGSVYFPPSQVIERVYWMVGLSHFTAIVDTVRTTLVELVAEMRAGSPPGASLPTHEVAEQAVDIAIKGNRNRITVNQVVPHAAGAASTGGVAAVDNAEPETRSKRWMWWVVGIATVIGAIAAIVVPLIA
jgi:hypothetical protein